MPVLLGGEWRTGGGPLPVQAYQKKKLGKIKKCHEPLKEVNVVD